MIKSKSAILGAGTRALTGFRQGLQIASFFYSEVNNIEQNESDY